MKRNDSEQMTKLRNSSIFGNNETKKGSVRRIKIETKNNNDIVSKTDTKNDYKSNNISYSEDPMTINPYVTATVDNVNVDYGKDPFVLSEIKIEEMDKRLFKIEEKLDYIITHLSELKNLKYNLKEAEKELIKDFIKGF